MTEPLELLEPRLTTVSAATGGAAPLTVQRVRQHLSGLVDGTMDRVFDEPLDVASSTEALALLNERDDGAPVRAAAIGASEWALASVARRLAPRLAGRAAALGSKTAGRLVLPVTLSVEVGLAARDGIRELQVLASFLITRLREAGLPVERDLVRRVTTSVYLQPTSRPDASRSGPQLAAAVARRWLARAVPGLGRNRPRHRAARVRAVERLDLPELVRRWPR